MPLSEVGLELDGVGLEGRQGFFILHPPRPKIFSVLECLCDESVCNADDLGLSDQLARCRCKFSTLVKSLDETSK